MRSAYLLSTLFFSIFTCTVSAQISLSGNVKDALTQNPIPGVTIYLHDLKKGTVTDSGGKYVFNNLPNGKFLIEFKSIGFGTLVQKVSPSTAPVLNVFLSSTITELNEVVISGVSYSTELKKNPIPISTLNSEVLEGSVSTNLIEKITNVAGVGQISTGPAISKPVIRGLSYNRIITLFDGIRQEGQQWGDEHGIEIDEFTVDRVEVIKGAGSLMYGSDGLGGVINFLPPNPLNDGVIESKLISNYQTNNNLFANSLMNAGNIKGLYWNARISNKIAQPYENKYDGRVFNSGFSEIDYSLIAGVSKSWGYSQMNFSSFNQTLGLVEGERDEKGNFISVFNENETEEERTVTHDELTTYKIFLPKQRIGHQRISNSTNLFTGQTRIHINTGFQKNKRKEFGDVLTPDDPDLFFDLTTLNYNVIAYLPDFKGWNFSFGGSGMYQQNKNRGKEFLIPQYSLQDLGGVAFIKKTVNKFDLAAGLRFDHRTLSIESLYLDEEGSPTSDRSQSLKFNAAKLNFNGLTASAGITYQMSDNVSFKSNFSRGYRAPNISELASNGRHEGSLRYEYGNYALKPEFSRQMDLGWLINNPHLSTEFSVFQNTINNYIFIEKLRGKNGLDSIADPQDPVPAYQYVQGTAQLTGGEITIDLHPHPLDWLHIENSFATVYARNKNSNADSTKYLPFIPAPRLQSELRATAKKWKSFGKLFVKLQYVHYWKQNRVLFENGTETPTPSYSFWNAGFGFDMLNRKDKESFTFYLTVMNIFDSVYQNHLSRLKYAAENSATGRTGVYNMGRNVSMKVVIPIGFKKTGK